MHLSKSWYESLPFFYVLIGAVSVMTLEPAEGVMGGWLLIASGLMVFYMRLQSRSMMSNLSSRGR